MAKLTIVWSDGRGETYTVRQYKQSDSGGLYAVTTDGVQLTLSPAIEYVVRDAGVDGDGA